MSTSTDELILRLAADLRSVRRLAAPSWRAGTWLGCVALIALALAARADLRAIGARLAAAPDMWLAVAGSIATAVLAAIAVFELSLPDRRPAWAWLPVPAVALWLGASGVGCLRLEPIGSTPPASLQEATRSCLPFILGLSIPLAAMLVAMLRRARPLRPGPVAAMGGLASAAAAASLLWFVHPFDAGLLDLVVHALAVLVVIALTRLAGARTLR